MTEDRCDHGYLMNDCQRCYPTFGIMPPVLWVKPQPTPSRTPFPKRPNAGKIKKPSLATIKKRFYRERNLCSVCLSRSRAPNQARCQPCLQKKFRRLATR